MANSLRIESLYRKLKSNSHKWENAWQTQKIEMSRAKRNTVLRHETCNLASIDNCKKKEIAINL